MNKMIDKLAFNAAALGVNNVQVPSMLQDMDPTDADISAEISSQHPDGQYISVGALPDPKPAGPLMKHVGPPPASQMVPEQPPQPPAQAQQPQPGAAPQPAPAPPQGQQQMPPAQTPAVQATPPAAPPMPPKTASLIEKLAYASVKKAFYGSPHPMWGQAPPMGNQFGFPGQMNNHAFTMNPSFYMRPGVGQTGGYGPPGMGMAGFMGNPRMDEATLEANYKRSMEQIQNMAGQIDPDTGKPYTLADITRRQNDLHQNTTRQLETMRQAAKMYGAGGGAPASPFAGGASGGAPGTPPFGFGGHPGGHAMPHGLPGFMPATGVPFGGSPFGGGYGGFGGGMGGFGGGFNPGDPFGSGGYGGFEEPEDVARARKLVETSKADSVGSQAQDAKNYANQMAEKIKLNKLIMNKGSLSDSEYEKAVKEQAARAGVADTDLQRADMRANFLSHAAFKPIDLDLGGDQKVTFSPGENNERNWSLGGLNAAIGRGSANFNASGTGASEFTNLSNMSETDLRKYLEQQKLKALRNSAPAPTAVNPLQADAQAKLDAYNKQKRDAADHQRKSRMYDQYQARLQQYKAHGIAPPPPPPEIADWVSGGGLPGASGAPAGGAPGGAPASSGPAGGIFSSSAAAASSPAPAPGGTPPAPAPAPAPAPSAPPPPAPAPAPAPGGAPPSPAPGATGGTTSAPAPGGAPGSPPPTTPAPPPGPPKPGGTAMAPGMPHPFELPKIASHRLTRPTVAQMAKMAARESEKRADAGAAMKTLAKLMGGGAVAGGAIGGLTAPSDYTPEGIMRGARLGLMAGAGAGVGGAIGSGATRGVVRGLNKGMPAGTPHNLLYPEETLSAVGKGIGGAVGGTAAAINDARQVGPSEWESGKLPLLERFDAAMRRKSPAPQFKAASAALESMGLLSNRKEQQAKQDAGSAEGRKAGFMGLLGAAGGAAGTAGIGALSAKLTGSSAMRGAGKGALLGGIGGLLGGSLAGAHRGHVLGRDSNAPSNTWLERRAPSLNPAEL